MYELYPFVTNDGTMGLFSPKDDDIYHSVQGAASEAYEKFIFPADINNFLINENQIRLLDICFGIGYNTKSFLNFIFQNKKLSEKIFSYSKRNKILSPYNDKIHSDNNFHRINSVSIYSDNILRDIVTRCCNYTIYGNNYNEKCINHNDLEKIFSKEINIYIKAIDMDKTLAFLSPFINSNIDINLPNQFENEKILKFSRKNKNFSNFNFKKIFKFLKNTKISQNEGLSKDLINYPAALNLYLLELIIKEYPELIKNKNFIDLLFDKKYKGYFSKELSLFIKLKHFSEYENNPFGILCRFLHNIYYKYLTIRYKNALKALNSLGIDFYLKFNDARLELQSDNSLYDLIFLDAFTPSKCSCLWSIDFFRLLFNHLSNNGILLTYSNSASVRNALLSAGFYIGKVFNPLENKFTGTIAAKNKNLIKNELSEFDLGLLKTKAGIFYRDKNLSALNEEIIARHENEVINSNLISATQYKKQFK